MDSKCTLNLSSWIQNVATTQQEGRIRKVLKLGEQCFRLTTAATWTMVAILERFCCAVTKTAFATKAAF